MPYLVSVFKLYTIICILYTKPYMVSVFKLKSILCILYTDAIFGTSIQAINNNTVILFNVNKYCS